MTNLLTLFATIGLAIDIFQVERVYGMRTSVAFQLMLLGMSVAKGMVDTIEFIEGSKRLWVWIMTQHESRMKMEAHRGSDQLTVFYREDDAVSDDGFNIMMLSVTEGSPRTPLHSYSLGLSATGLREFPRSSKSSLSNCSFSSESEMADRQQGIPPLRRSANSANSTDDDNGETSAVCVPAANNNNNNNNNSFCGVTVGVDGDAIHRTLQDRLKSQASAKDTQPSVRIGYTALMIDQPSEELADASIGMRHQPKAGDEDDDDPLI
jgi:hypothetical protein